MLAFKYQKSNFTFFTSLLVLLVFFLLMTGCNGGDGGGNSEEGGDDPSGEGGTPGTAQWYMHEIKHIDAEGLLVPQVSALPGNDGDVRIAYYSDGTDYGSENRYNINLLIWDPDEDNIVSEEMLDPTPPENGGEGLDNCNPLSLALGNLDYPIVAYQGGYSRDQGPGADDQSDVMFSVRDGGVWEEYMGAMGYVERNPLYDGLAGSDLSVAIDSQGYIHICYQFYYEGMDSYNFGYPDLNYVRHNGNTLNNLIGDGEWANIEEKIYGSDFTASSATHRNIGRGCKLLLDDSNNPVVFFVEHTDIGSVNAYGLWFARRESNGEWTRQWVDKVSLGWTIGDVSAAKGPEGNFAVAYSKVCQGCDADEGDHLKYAVQSGNSWDVQVVDESSICGHSPSLAFDSQGNPAIAYYDVQSHSGHNREFLKLASLSGSTWTSETVTEDDDFGHHNSLWFNTDNRPFICSYSEAVDDIAIFEKH
ncbi:MAG: hypothetical protein PVG39_10760 [Desulfobacteraceae bacterium]|jgi:hypothetical protein